MIITITGPAASGKTRLLKQLTAGKNVIATDARSFHLDLRNATASDIIAIDDFTQMDPLTLSGILDGEFLYDDRRGNIKHVLVPTIIIASQQTIPIIDIVIRKGRFTVIPLSQTGLNEYDPEQTDCQVTAIQRVLKP